MSILTKLGASDSSENRKEVRQALPANAPRGLTASAVRINLKEKKEIEAVSVRRITDKWQDEAWDYYDYIPEVASSANLVAGILSRINLYVGYVKKTSNAPSDISAVEEIDPELAKSAEDILYLLESAKGGTAGVLRDAALNFFIAGECYLVREPARFSTGEESRYQIRSINEVVAITSSRKPTLAIKPRRDSKDEELIKLPAVDGYIARMWRSHPRYGDEADSSLRPLLELCDSLLLLERTINAQAKAMLPAGILFVPDGLSNGYQADGDMQPELDEEGMEIAPLADDESEAFEERLQEALMAPLAAEDSGAVVVPLIIRGPADLGAKIQHIQLSRQFDPNHNNMAQGKLDRILGGLDIPKDVAAGFASVKYSNAILIEEQLYKAHIEPLILLIVDCLTSSFLRPALRAQGKFTEDEISRAVVWYDPSAITAKPSKAEAAVTLYGLGAISFDALRRANGFTDTDAPSELEALQRFGKEKGMLNEATTEMVVNSLIPKEMQEQLRQSQLANSDPNAVQALDQVLGSDAEMQPMNPPAPVETGGPPAEGPSGLLEP